MRRCRFGPALIEHDDATLEACPELAALPDAPLDATSAAGASTGAHVIITAGDELPAFSPTHFVAKRRLAFDAHAYQVRFEPRVSYAVEGAFRVDAPIRLAVSLRPETGLSRVKSTAAALEARFHGLEGLIEPSPIAGYSLLWYVMHLALWKLGASFVHGAAWARAGSATLLLGSGGCGKTSSLLTLRERGLAEYLAEDFVIVDQLGQVHPCPKTVTLYRSDLEATGALQASGFVRRLAVAASRGIVAANPKFKVLPSAVFGPLAPAACPIRHAVFTARTSEAAPRLEAISASELARRAALASMRELKPLSEILQMIVANAPQDYAYPTPQAHAAAVEARYARALGSASTYLLWAPERFPPGELIDFMVAHGLVDASGAGVG